MCNTDCWEELVLSGDSYTISSLVNDLLSGEKLTVHLVDETETHPWRKLTILVLRRNLVSRGYPLPSWLSAWWVRLIPGGGSRSSSTGELGDVRLTLYESMTYYPGWSWLSVWWVRHVPGEGSSSSSTGILGNLRLSLYESMTYCLWWSWLSVWWVRLVPGGSLRS